MVRTTTGPAEKSQPKKVTPKPSAEDRKMERTLDLDDQTWDRIEQMAKSQGIEPNDLVRNALHQVYGSDAVTEAFNAG